MAMRPRARKFTLILHVISSVGWIGAVAAYIALDVTTVTSQDAPTLRAVYVAMASITRHVIVPLAWAALLSGVVISLGTKWGLVRHYWVLISLALTVVAVAVLMVETQTINHFAAIAADPGTSSDTLRSLGSTLPHSVGGTFVLVVITALNVYKPPGMTSYGWRKQHERRQREEGQRLAAATALGSIGKPAEFER